MSLVARLRPLLLRLLALAGRARPVAPLFARLLIGEGFLLTGLGKLRHFDRTVAFFDGLGIPFPTLNAGFVGALELVGGALLVLGLGTRLMAALLSGTMVVALLTADRGAFLSSLVPGGEPGLTNVPPVMFLGFLLYLITHGPGRWSVDRLLAPKLGLGAAGRT